MRFYFNNVLVKIMELASTARADMASATCKLNQSVNIKCLFLLRVSSLFRVLSAAERDNVRLPRRTISSPDVILAKSLSATFTIFTFANPRAVFSFSAIGNGSAATGLIAALLYSQLRWQQCAFCSSARICCFLCHRLRHTAAHLR